MGCGQSNAMAGKYDDYDWKELPPDARKAAETLGYTKKIWDKDGNVPADDLDWEQLSPEQQAAASVLGYNKEKWHADDSSSSSEED